jgi:hypothetical protein
VDHGSGEILKAGNRRDARLRELTAGRDEEVSHEVSLAGLKHPSAAVFVVVGEMHLGAEESMSIDAEPRSDPSQILLDLGLRREAP